MIKHIGLLQYSRNRSDICMGGNFFGCAGMTICDGLSIYTSDNEKPFPNVKRHDFNKAIFPRNEGEAVKDSTGVTLFRGTASIARRVLKPTKFYTYERESKQRNDSELMLQLVGQRDWPVADFQNQIDSFRIVMRRDGITADQINYVLALDLLQSQCGTGNRNVYPRYVHAILR